MSFQLDKKQKVKEILKCGKDPAYFLKTYARISHPMHGLILFDTYDFQDDLLKDFNDYFHVSVIYYFLLRFAVFWHMPI